MSHLCIMGWLIQKCGILQQKLTHAICQIVPIGHISWWNFPTHLCSLQIAKDLDYLFSMLSYQTFSSSKTTDSHRTYTLINKNKNRNKYIRKPCFSILVQLQQKKKKQTLWVFTQTTANRHCLKIPVLPYMDTNLRELVQRTIQTVGTLAKAEYAKLAVYASDEVCLILDGWHRYKAAKQISLWKIMLQLRQ